MGRLLLWQAQDAGRWCAIAAETQVVQPGDIVWTHCSRCMDRSDHVVTYIQHNTDHLFTGDGRGLVCLVCRPELDPRQKETEA